MTVTQLRLLCVAITLAIAATFPALSQENEIASL